MTPGPRPEAQVLITGASSGIGAALAAALATLPARLILTGSDGERLEQIARPLGASTLVADLAVPGAGAELAARAVTLGGRIDVVVNGAGLGAAGATPDTPPDVDRMVAVNLTAPIQLTQALLPPMLDRGSGHLVFIGSIAGALGVRHEAVYAATKAALATFAASLRQEVTAGGVDVVLVVPGVVDTPFFARRGAPYARRWPRPIPPERVALAVLDGLRTGRAEVVVPRWLSIPLRLHGATPGLYRRLATRWG